MKEEIEKNLCRCRLYNGGGQWSVLVLVMVLKLAGDRRVASVDHNIVISQVWYGGRTCKSCSVEFPFNLPVSLIPIAPKPVYLYSETTRLHRMYCFSRLSTRKSTKKWPRVLQSVKLCPPSSEPCKCDKRNEEEGLRPK